jgi:hypothetical protein
MKNSFLAAALLAGIAILSAAEPAWAQNPRRSRYSPYRPSSPTLSPYLDLLRSDVGPLPNYHMYYRPRVQVRRTLEEQDLALRRQAAGMRTLGTQVGQLQGAAAIRPTGTAGTFMNYSHYYRMGPASRGR